MATASTMTKPGPSGVLKATGREREEWFALLDEWGAAGRPFREIATWLKTQHKLSHWWAQKLIVEYEQARGLRPAGIRPDGTFSVTASRTVSVPLERLYEAFADAKLRRRWLPGARMRVRTSERGRSARFDWKDGNTRMSATFESKGRSKSQVGVEHALLPDSKAAEKMKAYWRERLTALKSLLEEGSA